MTKKPHFIIAVDPASKDGDYGVEAKYMVENGKLVISDIRYLAPKPPLPAR